MIVSVWLTHKPGEHRIYTTTVCPSEQQMDAFKRDGFTTFEARVVLPIHDEDEVPIVHSLAFDKIEYDSDEAFRLNAQEQLDSIGEKVT